MPEQERVSHQGLPRTDLRGTATCCDEAVAVGRITAVVENGKAVVVFHTDCTVVFCFTPRKCPACQAPKTFFVNRDGRTVCAECDGDGSPNEKQRGANHAQTLGAGRGRSDTARERAPQKA